MKIITTLIIVLALFLPGCTKFTNTLGAVQDATIKARATFQPVVDGICRDLSKQCKSERQVSFRPVATELEQKGACDAYEQCHQIRTHIISVFKHIAMLIADAELSSSIGDQDSADEALGKALELVAMIRDQLRMLGYI